MRHPPSTAAQLSFFDGPREAGHHIYSLVSIRKNVF